LLFPAFEVTFSTIPVLFFYRSVIPVFRYTLDFKCWNFVPYFCYALKRLTGYPVQGFWTKYYPKGGDFGQNPQGLSLHGVKPVSLPLHYQKHGLTTFATSSDTIFFSSLRYFDGHQLEP